jgi:Flp pilus assembly protein TadD
MEERQTLRQATKLWPEEIDAEFGRPYNDIGVYLMRRGNLDEAISWLQKARQARGCEPRAVPLHESGADLP